MTAFNVVFCNNGSQYTTKFHPNEVEVLNSWKADMCLKVEKSIVKVAFVRLLRPLREGNLMLSIPFWESQHHRSGLAKVLQFIDWQYFNQSTTNKYSLSLKSQLIFKRCQYPPCLYITI